MFSYSLQPHCSPLFHFIPIWKCLKGLGGCYLNGLVFVFWWFFFTLQHCSILACLKIETWHHLLMDYQKKTSDASPLFTKNIFHAFYSFLFWKFRFSEGSLVYASCKTSEACWWRRPSWESSKLLQCFRKIVPSAN